jgi:hypothetical protein
VVQGGRSSETVLGAVLGWGGESVGSMCGGFVDGLEDGVGVGVWCWGKSVEI